MIPKTFPIPSISYLEVKPSLLDPPTGPAPDDVKFFESFPPGYRFCPLDEELIDGYLKKKITNQPLPRNMIMEVKLYRYNPEKLAEMYRHCGEKEWYFFTPRDKKYRNGNRPSRAAGDGYWKATGADKPIKRKGDVIGYKRALVFYQGRPPKGEKTNWIMNEYRINDPPRRTRSPNDMRLDDWVLCRIHKKAEKLNSRARLREDLCSQHETENDTVTDNCHFGMDISFGSPSYTNAFVEPLPLSGDLDLPTMFSGIPHYEPIASSTNYVHGEYGSLTAIPQMVEPISVLGNRPLQMHSAEEIFSSKYLNNNFSDSSSIMSNEEWPCYSTNYGSDVDTAGQMDVVSLKNLVNMNNNSLVYLNNNWH